MSFHPNDVVRRGRAATVIICGVLVFLLSAFFNTQVLKNEKLLLQSEDNRLRQIPCQLAGQDGVSVLCRLADLSAESFVVAGEQDDFLRHFGSSMPRRIEARVGDTLLAGEVTREEIDTVQRLRRVAVKIDGDRAREVLVKLLK